MHGPTCIFWANLTPFSLKEILAIVKNEEALAIHQDSWGKQGRRVLSTPPPNRLLGPDPTDAILALTRCD